MVIELINFLPAVHYLAAGAAPTTVPGLTGDVTQALQEGSTGIMAVGGVGGGTMFGYHSLMKVVSPDPQDVAQHTRSQKKVLVGSIAVVLAGGLVKMVTGFF